LRSQKLPEREVLGRTPQALWVEGEWEAAGAVTWEAPRVRSRVARIVDFILE